MDINSRVVQLQQVMSTFAFTCPKNSTVMLASAENFHPWHAGLSAILTSYGSGLLEFFQSGDLSLPADVVEINDPAVMQLSLVLNNCLQVVLNHTVKYDILARFQAEGLTGFALLTAIRRDYSTLSPRQLYAMVGEMFSIKAKSPSDAAKFLRSFRTQFNHGMSIDHLFGLIFLQAFNSEDAVRRVVDSANPSLEFSAVETILRDLIVPSTSVTSSVAPAQAFAVSKSGSGSGSRRRRKPPVCYRCHQKGHTSNVCTAPAPVAASSSQSISTSSNSAKVSENSNVTWCASAAVDVSAATSYSLDSGSTLHLSKNRDHFIDFLPCSNGQVSGISDGSLAIHGYGSIQFGLANGELLTVRNVAYVPNAVRNLLSVKMICQSTASFMVFDKDIVKLSSGLAIGRYKAGSLYEFLYAPIVQSSVALAATSSNDVLWHSRLGHPSPNVMKAMGYSPPADVKLCVSCCAGNMTRNYPKYSTTPTTTPLQLLHVDVCGSFPTPGLNNEHFFLTIVDDFTRWSHIVPLVAKSDSFDAVQLFIKQAETQFSSSGFKVQNVRSDNGGEFCNHNFRAFFQQKGISHQLTVPYNSSQNGVAERKHRHVQEKARTLLDSSGLSMKFWNEAVKMGEFLINRYPTPKLSGMSAFEKWFGVAPNYSVFRPFGCFCMVFIPPEKRSSVFSPVSSPGFLLGFSAHHKAYRCFVFAVNDVVVSNNVRFNENYFPLLKSAASATVQSGAAASFDIAAANTGNLPSDVCFGFPAGGMPLVSDTMSSSVSDHDFTLSNPSSSPPATGVQAGTSSSCSSSAAADIQAGSSSSTAGSSSSSSDPSYQPSAPLSATFENDPAFPEADFPSSHEHTPPAVLPSAPDHSLALVKRSTFLDGDHGVPVEESLIPIRRTLSSAQLSDHFPASHRRQLHAPAPESSLNISDSQLSGPTVSLPDPKLNGDVAMFTGFHQVHNVYTASADNTAQLPSTYAAALSSSDASHWRSAISKELLAHRDNKTWVLAPLPAGRRAIGSRWVFTIKDATTPPTYKARLVAQGFRQVYGIDFFETFSPVVRYESIRILFALSVQFDLVVHQLDVVTAFLNGSLDEEIYMAVPSGVSAPHGMVCKLNKSLYGLRQAPARWNSAINSVLVNFGFKRSVVEFGIYSLVTSSGIVLVALYVDDLLIASDCPAMVDKVKQLLFSHYKMKDMGLVTTFLGMQVCQSSSVVSVKLTRYLTNMLDAFDMLNCNAVSTPFAAGTDFHPGTNLSDAEITCFRSMVGKLLFASNTCRPDLAFAASTLSRFIKDPKANHLAAAKHVLRYVKGTLNLGLTCKKTTYFNLIGYSDSDWAGDKMDRKSITGYVFLLAGCAITWKAKKQQTVALSSTEAEYMALGDAVKELLWLKQLLNHVGLKFKSPPIIFEDNEGCKLLSNHPVHHQRTKHIDIRHHFVRNHIDNGIFKLESARTDDMFADMFTKNLVRVKFNKFVELIGMTKV